MNSRFETNDECPSQDAIGMIADKWKLLILIRLSRVEVLRFKELQRSLGTVSQKVLTAALRELERDGLVSRTVYAEVPPRVEYRATCRTHALMPILRNLEDWAVSTSAKTPNLVPARFAPAEPLPPWAEHAPRALAEGARA